MPKKIRFPLEMDNGVEVRSMDELRDNFSLLKVLEYVENGKLITWLKDRYLDDVAEEIENLDMEGEGLGEKVCRILDVPFQEATEEDIEKAEERRRKLKLLEEHPDCMEYADKIDFIAFDQDDLYDLLDEDVDEIYLCGERFSIPASKGNISYIGILQAVEVCIDAKVPVDFDAKGITFENCVFDARYQKLLGNKMRTDSVETLDRQKSIVLSAIDVALQSAISAMSIDSEDYGEDADFSQINNWVDAMLENLEDIDDSVFDEYDNPEERKYSYNYTVKKEQLPYYFKHNYYSVYEAKAALIETVSSAFIIVYGLYNSEKQKLIDCTEKFYEPIKPTLLSWLDDFCYDLDFIIDCDEDVLSKGSKRYLNNKIEILRKNLFVDEGISHYHMEGTFGFKIPRRVEPRFVAGDGKKDWERQVEDEYDNVFAQAVRDMFGSEEEKAFAVWYNTRKVPSEYVDKILERCEIEEDDYGYNVYSFNINDFCKELVAYFAERIETYEEKFPEMIKERYTELTLRYFVEILKPLLDGLRKRTD